MAVEDHARGAFLQRFDEKHVPVKGLVLGMCSIPVPRAHDETAAPAEFWIAYRFTREQIVLDEQSDTSVPRQWAAKVKSATVQPVISEAGGIPHLHLAQCQPPA